MGEINEMYSNHALLHAPYAHPHHEHPEISVGLCPDLQHEGAVSGELSTCLSLSLLGVCSECLLCALGPGFLDDSSTLMVMDGAKELCERLESLQKFHRSRKAMPRTRWKLGIGLLMSVAAAAEGEAPSHVVHLHPSRLPATPSLWTDGEVC